MVRAVRDKRYKYIRNYYPEKPYLLWIPYRNRHPIMQEMWRLHAAGKLEGDEAVMFQYPRPAEELYDITDDRYEFNNLASDAAHADVLERMRGALAQWQSDFGDMGDIPEEQMVARWYPGGEQPKTAAPIFIPICAASPGTEVSESGGRWEAPLLLQLHCATHGASMAWTMDSGDDARWRLYTEPLQLPKGETTVRAKAVRIGYQESDERAVTVDVV